MSASPAGLGPVARFDNASETAEWEVIRAGPTSGINLALGKKAGAAVRITDVEVNRSGRYVRVQLEGTEYPQLAETEVFGSAGSVMSGESHRIRRILESVPAPRPHVADTR